MKAIVILATLKAEGKSNTEVLTEFVISYLEKLKLIDSKGLWTDMIDNFIQAIRGHIATIKD